MEDIKFKISKLRKWLLNFYSHNQICEFCNVGSSCLYGFLNGHKRISNDTRDHILQRLIEMKNTVIKERGLEI